MRLATIMSLVVIGALLTMAGSNNAGLQTPEIGKSPSSAAAAWPISVPETATNGVVTITIPPGTADVEASGEQVYDLPPVMELKVGDTIEIRNEDTSPHIVLYAFVAAGATHQRTFTDTGSETYSAGCSPSASEFNDFTTIFVSK